MAVAAGLFLTIAGIAERDWWSAGRNAVLLAWFCWLALTTLPGDDGHRSAVLGVERTVAARVALGAVIVLALTLAAASLTRDAGLWAGLFLAMAVAAAAVAVGSRGRRAQAS